MKNWLKRLIDRKHNRLMQKLHYIHPHLKKSSPWHKYADEKPPVDVCVLWMDYDGLYCVGSQDADGRIFDAFSGIVYLPELTGLEYWMFIPKL